MDHWNGKECLLFQQFFFMESWKVRNYFWQGKFKVVIFNELTVCTYREWKSAASRRNSNPGWVSTISFSKQVNKNVQIKITLVISDWSLLMGFGKGWKLGLMQRERLFNFNAGTKGGYIIYAITQWFYHKKNFLLLSIHNICATIHTWSDLNTQSQYLQKKTIQNSFNSHNNFCFVWVMHYSTLREWIMLNYCEIAKQIRSINQDHWVLLLLLLLLLLLIIIIILLLLLSLVIVVIAVEVVVQ